MSILDTILLILLGFGAGFLNVMAGGGSMLVLPFLLFLGLPAPVANATNRIAIILQNIVAVKEFHKGHLIHLKTDAWLLPPVILGCTAGAFTATGLNENTFKIIIAVLLLLLSFLIIAKPTVWIKSRAEKMEVNSKAFWLRTFIFLAIGFYGGFIQMGVGFFLLAGLVLGCGFDLLKANALKVLFILLFNIPALAIFIAYDLVDWRVGLILACGNMSGAWVASRLSIQKGSAFIRYFLIMALIISSIKIMWDIL